MQSTDVIVSFYCKDPVSTGTEDCPTFYRTNRSSWIVQGDRHDEHVKAQLRGLKPTETSVEIPERLVDQMVVMYAKERYGVDLTGTSRRTDPQHAPLPEARTA
ncbi:hypothetical protein [Nonomuraea basaltis]|uniref:hypothetical protein n=1 Tax=Nonomuraea basaltis TaxID=2495887 RepID=UPI00110C5044|nr:hypothetical protein [Nonomuraea basaltis]TMR91305.1 hypothetical protein EJK15_50845 [Nonomuraea basaltis]